MGLSAHAHNALRQSLGLHAGNEVAKLLGQLANESQVEEAYAKSKLDKAADISATAVKLNKVIPPVIPATAPVPAPPVAIAVAPPPSVPATNAAADDSSVHDAPS
jgi:hypothetical protein